MTQGAAFDKSETVNVVTSIFGHNENSNEEGGKQNNSAVPGHYDKYFHGDDRTTLPIDLSTALGEKNLEEYSQPFPNYRINTGLEIGFNTDGQTISSSSVLTDEWYMEYPTSISPVTLEGGVNESNPFRTTYDYDGTDDYLPANTHGPFPDDLIETNEDGYQGVRGSIIFGGNDPYIVKHKELGESFGSLIPGFKSLSEMAYFLEIPSFYVFLDFLFMADGTKVVRVWDASRYPAHALYVGGERVDQTDFREDIEWTTNGPFWKDNAFEEFAREATAIGRNPFGKYGSWNYKWLFFFGYGLHPVMIHYENGDNLDAQEVAAEFDVPFLPESYIGSQQ